MNLKYIIKPISFCMGIFISFFIFLFIYINYSDYRAVVQIKNWIRLIEYSNLKQKTEENLKSDSKIIIKKPELFPKPDIFDITRSGLILIKGGVNKQILIIIPNTLEDGNISWRCLAGPITSSPRICNFYSNKGI